MVGRDGAALDLPILETARLQEAPVFCFTSDMDWASEFAIEETMEFFAARSIPLTPFATHPSDVLRRRYCTRELEEQVGAHPNFLMPSSHGETPEDVVSYVRNMLPRAEAFRSHAFFDNSHVTALLVKNGFRYDSNLCLFLQPACLPLLHQSGLVRFPVFWEDDVHFGKNLPFDFSLFRRHVDTPGLKVINVHPIHLALNTPSSAFYQATKALNDVSDAHRWRQAAFHGAGVRAFLEALTSHIQSRGYRICSLRSLYHEVTGADRTPRHEVRMGTRETPPEDEVMTYRSATRDERATIVRRIYEERDATNIYATSRDFNLRELEISFIKRHFRGGRILDLGCGNGYTLISLARVIPGDFTGIDFSPNLLDGAKQLLARFESELCSKPVFIQGDVRDLPFSDSSFDTVISERCLLNLPTREDQELAIREAHRVLAPGGRFISVEGTEDGLGRLNRVRRLLGLDAIPSTARDNVSSLKFSEGTIESYFRQFFHIEAKQSFGTYYLISRVVHPLLVAPESPRFDAKINTIARQVAEILPDVGGLGHVVGYHLVSRKCAA
jgi:ubiquinone/menaquinone biosynthesis C-methylase UbiE